MPVADEPNLASAAAGATVIGATEGSLNAEALIDGTEATNWGGVTEGNVDADAARRWRSTSPVTCRRCAGSASAPS